MCPITTEVYRDSLVLAKDTTVSIGTIEKAQKTNDR